MKMELNSGRSQKVYYELELLEQMYLEAKVKFEEILAENSRIRMLVSEHRSTETDMHLGIYDYHTRSAKSWSNVTLTYRVTGEMVGSKWNYNTGTSTSGTYTSKDGLLQLDKADAIWRRLLQKNEDFIKHARKDAFRPPDCFSWLGDTIVNTVGARQVIMRSIYKNLKHVCETCTEEVNPAQMVKHQKTLKCFQRSKLEAAKNRGLVYTRDRRLIKVATDGVVAGEWVPVKFDTYVPTWVIKASEMFDKGEGYAGMELEAFILEIGKNEQES